MSSNKEINPASSARGSELASNFTVSLNFDKRLYKQDILVSIAHAKMLGKQEIISDEDSKLIVSGLIKIQKEIESDKFPWDEKLEDIHMNIESRLFEIIGNQAGKLHTARSRNDQVATDIRLWIKDACINLIENSKKLQLSLLSLAKNNLNVSLPGYTHLQKAQPILLSHHFLAYFEMFQRDIERWKKTYNSADVMPLGSGAISGVPYNIDRKYVAEELGFSFISNNSIDAVSDRDFIVEFISASSICMSHLSKLSEEIVIWSSDEFNFISLSDEYTSGSSIMPQKRNPDFAELIRGKTGRVYGDLIGILTVLKGLPLSYNRDLQEDKESTFDAYDTTLACIKSANGIVKNLIINDKIMKTSAEKGFILATDIADYLTKKGLPFRQSHIIMTKLSNHCKKLGKDLSEISVEEYKSISKFFSDDVKNISVNQSINSREIKGGTSLNQIKNAIKNANITINQKWPK
ncbi:MAG: argininosuccinate lyase [Chloroflexi bacterium]|nr:argininosuccinate lyase [Chloroflexota bacterium]|tara:strand:- start:52591 stop:53982 length:1392 start_codon:yes stop_codon:yes gene_type:complete